MGKGSVDLTFIIIGAAVLIVLIVAGIIIAREMFKPKPIKVIPVGNPTILPLVKITRPGGVVVTNPNLSIFTNITANKSKGIK